MTVTQLKLLVRLVRRSQGIRWRQRTKEKVTDGLSQLSQGEGRKRSPSLFSARRFMFLSVCHMWHVHSRTSLLTAQLPYIYVHFWVGRGKRCIWISFIVIEIIVVFNKTSMFVQWWKKGTQVGCQFTRTSLHICTVHLSAEPLTGNWLISSKGQMLESMTKHA